MFDDSKVTYTVNATRDQTPIRGNVLASGDKEEDRAAENAILRRSSVWAWASVRVTARYAGIWCVEGNDYLGCCSYKDRDDFERCQYYADMKDRARADLYAQLSEIMTALGHPPTS